MAENVYRAPVATPADPGRRELRRSPLLAAALSLVIPGAGQLYNGRFVLGGLIFLTVHAIWIVFTGGFHRDARETMGVVALGGVVILASVVEAAVRASRRGFVPRRLFHRWFVFLPVLALLAAAPIVRPGISSGKDAETMSEAAMEPTIRAGEMVLVDWRHYRDRPPRRGDVVLLDSPHDSAEILRRVIGLPGERVEVHGGRAVIDGDPALDRWAHLEGQPVEGELSGVLPAGAYLVLADNRNDGRDSRSFGFVTEDRIFGRALSIYSSNDFDRIGLRLTD